MNGPALAEKIEIFPPAPTPAPPIKPVAGGEGMLRTLWRAVEQSRTAVFITDAQGNVQYANPRFEEITGYSLEETMGRNPRFLKSGAHSLSFYRNLWEVLRRGEVWRGQIQNRRKNGELYWESNCISPVRGEDGDIIHFVSIKEDISEEVLLQSALDALSAHIAILNEKGTIIAVNAAWNRFARENNCCGDAVAVGRNYLAVCECGGRDGPPEAIAVANGIRDVMAGCRTEVVMEYPCHSPTEQRWFLVRVTRFAGEGPVRVVVAHENITARKKAEEELKWKTAFLEAQVNASIDGILVIDEHGKKILQNEQVAWLLGIPRAIAESADDAPQLQWVSQATKSPEKFLERVRYLTSHPEDVSRDEMELTNGAVLDRYSCPVKGGDGRYYGRVWTFRDITKRRQAEEQLRQSEEKFRQLADNITDVFWIRSPDLSTLHYVSKGYELIWGHSVESLLANPRQWKEAIIPEQRERVAATLGQLTQNEREIAVEYQIIRPDGTLRWICDRGFQVRNAAGKVVRITGIASDVTQRKQAALQLMVTKDAAEAANRAKSEFLAMMSHEIRTPMNGILGFASLLRETELTSAQRHFADTIHHSGRTLLSLIDDILDFSKIEAGKLTLESIPYCLTGLVREVADLLTITAHQRNLGLQIECDSGVPAQFVGDPSRVRQVLLNLVGNAIKFTKEGEVNITIKRDFASPGLVRICVTDTGIGIPAQKQGALFQLFCQADSTTTRRYGGTGLGLAICRKLVHQMGGQIGLTSVPGKGSAFWFTLPARNAAGNAHALAAPIHRGEAARPGPRLPPLLRVLLAEDESVNQELVSTFLNQLACEVKVAPDGREAVALARQFAPHLIFMDCLMPEMDGFEATREIRRAEDGRTRVPIVALTAAVTDGQREKCLAAGMDDFIEKPVQPCQLEQTLLKWVFHAGRATPPVSPEVLNL